MRPRITVAQIVEIRVGGSSPNAIAKTHRGGLFYVPAGQGCLPILDRKRGYIRLGDQIPLGEEGNPFPSLQKDDLIAFLPKVIHEENALPHADHWTLVSLLIKLATQSGLGIPYPVWMALTPEQQESIIRSRAQLSGS